METKHKKYIEEIADLWGFYGLVFAVKFILKRHYPLYLFNEESPDKGPRFTAKLHEALAILDDSPLKGRK